MSTAMPFEPPASTRVLAEPAMRRLLEDFVRRRVPASDVDDIVQTVLMEALSSASRPHEESELRPWLLGIARHKVVDHHRRSSRETATDLPDLPVGPPPVEARSLALWAEEQAGASQDAQSTLEWMAREGEGEKLEAIAEEEKVPAARIRQRVSRMRRWMKERWLAELAAAAALVVVAFLAWRIFHKEELITQPVPEKKPSPSSLPDEPVLERARALRDKAFEDCDRSAWKDCLDKLDEAKGLDPAGDNDSRVGSARARASDALQNQAPAPTTSQSSVPTSAPPPLPKSAPLPKSVPSSVPNQKSPPPKPKSDVTGKLKKPVSDVKEIFDVNSTAKSRGKK
jgi:DNA-directed RNA polymerase specialized sigma24 family protein